MNGQFDPYGQWLKIPAWDQLLAELFPTSGRADLQRREPQLARLREEGPDEPTRSGAAGRTRRKPPRLPRVYAEHEVADESQAIL